MCLEGLGSNWRVQFKIQFAFKLVAGLLVPGPLSKVTLKSPPPLCFCVCVCVLRDRLRLFLSFLFLYEFVIVYYVRRGGEKGGVVVQKEEQNSRVGLLKQ